MERIREFLSHRRLAIVGVSHHPSDFSRLLFREFAQRCYDVVPVNPAWQEIEGRKCYAHLRDIERPVEGALLMTSPAVTDEVVKECAALGIRRVWMYRSSPQALAFCSANGIDAIAGECPLMYLSGAGWIHRLHGWLHGVSAS